MTGILKRRFCFWSMNALKQVNRQIGKVWAPMLAAERRVDAFRLPQYLSHLHSLIMHAQSLRRNHAGFQTPRIPGASDFSISPYKAPSPTVGSPFESTSAASSTILTRNRAQASHSTKKAWRFRTEDILGYSEQTKGIAGGSGRALSEHL